MRRIVNKNKKGFTLVELLVSMLVLSIGMMAMLDGIANYIRINIDNTARNEAMRIAETTLETLRNSSFSNVSTNNNTAIGISTSQQRRIRNININYAVNWQSTSLSVISGSVVSVAIEVHVTWTHRGVNHRHDAATIISTDV